MTVSVSSGRRRCSSAKYVWSRISVTTTCSSGDAELGERGDEQVVGQRPGRLDPLQRVVDRRRLGRPDVDRQQAAPPDGLAQQDHGRVGRDLDPDADELERHHTASVPRRPPPQPSERAAAVRARTAGAPWRAGVAVAELGAEGVRARRVGVVASARACGVALAQQRHDQLLVQADLAFDRRAPRPQVPGIDAGAQEPAGGGGDLDRVLAVQLGARAALGDHAVLLELRRAALGSPTPSHTARRG